METGRFGELAATILDRPPFLGDVRVVAVDGGTGAGKSTVASALERGGHCGLAGAGAAVDGDDADVPQKGRAVQNGGRELAETAGFHQSPRSGRVSAGDAFVMVGEVQSSRGNIRITSTALRLDSRVQLRLFVWWVSETAWGTGKNHPS